MFDGNEMSTNVRRDDDGLVIDVEGLIKYATEQAYAHNVGVNGGNSEVAGDGIPDAEPVGQSRKQVEIELSEQ